LLIFNVTFVAALKFLWRILLWGFNFIRGIFVVQKLEGQPAAKQGFPGLPKEVLAPLSAAAQAAEAEESAEEKAKEAAAKLAAAQAKLHTIPAAMQEVKEIKYDRDDSAVAGGRGNEAPLKSKSGSAYKLPSVDLLDDPTAGEKKREESLQETTEARKQILENVLRNFGVGATVVSASQGPAVTKFEIQPDLGVKVSKIFALSDDIALNLATGGIRIEGPVPGKSVIGIEVPNPSVTPVRLKKIVKTTEFNRSHSKLFLALGQDLAGTPIYGDLTRMPHLLIAGTTGSGKSVCINSVIVSILLRAHPDEVKFIMIDPKMVELSTYDGIPHLLAPVVTDAKKAAITLKHWVLKEMERRYREFHAVGVRNIEIYNQKMDDTGKREQKMPLVVVIVDELADLMMVAAKEVETSICRIAQMARATGIHLVIATQRPSVDVITGLIKANIPSRIAFAVATQVDSRVILDMSGAEKLLGRGDMLYNPIGAMKPVRLQGSFVTDKETERIIKHCKSQERPDYIKEIIDLKMDDFTDMGGGGDSEQGADGRDALFKEAVKIVLNGGNPSTSHLQRRMRIGYNRAARLMDEMEAAGIVSAMEGENKARQVTATPEVLQKLGIS
jgi:S-DNA-T family DNA segregation ATPase FtsK/SpoIIIE